jgi:hypothetical protein
MERLRYRSTSLVDIQAELRERELLAEAERARAPRVDRPRRPAMLFGLPLVGRRPGPRRSGR